ncbi:hypothetical protein J4207_05915 [Candidatus Woesearchaeota archaeon]|nr:hypothetical protein [Candidatus Woesearchaeota archaeon]
MKRTGGFVIHAILLLIFLLGTVQAVFAVKGKLLYVEVFILLGLIALAFLGMVQYTRGNDAQVRAVYAIGLVNILALSLLKWQLFFIPLVPALIGLGVSFAKDEVEHVPVVEPKIKEPEVKIETVEEKPKPAKRKRGRPKKKK